MLDIVRWTSLDISVPSHDDLGQGPQRARGDAVSPYNIVAARLVSQLCKHGSIHLCLRTFSLILPEDKIALKSVMDAKACSQSVAGDLALAMTTANEMAMAKAMVIVEASTQNVECHSMEASHVLTGVP